ncbi:MAG: nitroreductase family deazaflavin-dependent oxidoreductase [Chloroflexota bacterium]|nr:nitroreductase family deazaflavin-dependent oxidoreductase [Chloroflexota bacterium]
MAFPYWIARVNRLVTNRVLARLVGKIPNLALLHHQGRRSGQPYQTPIMAFPLDGIVAIALTYGADVDWLKNVVAADGCTVASADREWVLTSPRIVRGADLPGTLPVPFRVFLRILRVDTYVLLSIRS